MFNTKKKKKKKTISFVNSGSSNGRTLNVSFRSLWVQIPSTVLILVLWCNGSTSDFLSDDEGSTPFRTNYGKWWNWHTR